MGIIIISHDIFGSLPYKTTIINHDIFGSLPGLPVGRPSQVLPRACQSPRYRAWQDPEGRIYYEDLETGSTDKHLPGVLEIDGQG